MFKIHVYSLSCCPADHVFDQLNVFRMHSLKDQLYGMTHCPVISHDAKRLVPPNELTTRDFPPKTPRSTKSLCLGYISLAAPQCFHAAFALRSIINNYITLTF